MKRFLAILATGAFALGLSTSGYAQTTRAVGAAALILDDNQTPAHKMTIQTPQPGSQAYTDWQTASFPALTWSVPVPPSAGAQSGFILPGPQNITVGPIQVPYWIYPNNPPNTSNLNGTPTVGGSTGTWNYATPAQLGIVTSASGTINFIAKFDAPNDLANSLLFDDGTALNYNAGKFTVAATTGNTTAAGSITGVGNITSSNGLLASGSSGGPAGGVTLWDGGTNKVSIAPVAMAASRSYTLPDAGGAASFIMSTSPTGQTIGGGLTINGGASVNGGLNNNAGGITNTGAISGATTITASGNINTTGGALQTNTVTRVDNAGNLTNIGSETLSGAISGGTTYSGSGNIITSAGNINATAGAIQTAGTTRIDNGGNLTNIGNETLSGAISGGTTYSGSGNITTSAGNINATAGAIQTAGTTRITNGGNLTNIGSETLSGAISGGTTYSGSGSITTTGGLLNAGTDATSAGQLTLHSATAGANKTGTLQLLTGATFNTANRTYSLPDATGTVSLGGIINGTTTNSTLRWNGTSYVENTSVLATSGGNITLGTPGATAGTLTLADPGSVYSGTLETATLTANRTYQLPDRTGQFFATTSQTNYTDIVLLQAASVQQMAAGTTNGIAIQELAGATGAFQVFYDPSMNPLFTVGNTGNVITADYINVSNTTATSSISSGVTIPTTLAISSAGGAGTVGVNLGTSGSPETGLTIQSTSNDLVLAGQTQLTAVSFTGQGALGMDIHDFGAGGYTSGINVEVGGTTNGNYAVQATADNATAAKVDAVSATILRKNANGASADYIVTPASAKADGGSPIFAVGAADATHYSNGVTIKNGAFALAGAVQPAGKITGIDANAANTTKTINNPLCTSDAIIILTPADDDAATAQWYVASTSDGSFVIENHTATGAANASNVNYFIITPITR